MRKLFLVPARGGSKGLPGKNILPLAGRPMIEYTLDAALGAMEDGDELCVSTDDLEIIEVAEKYGVKVPFVRPCELASDESSTDAVIIHALNWYKNKDITFDLVVLLQVTSPLRNSKHVREALTLQKGKKCSLVSVKLAKSNPYFVLFEENNKGHLIKSKEGHYTRRQDCPKVWELNGAIYIYDVKASVDGQMLNPKGRIKYVMDDISSVDIDTEYDFLMANLILQTKFETVKSENIT